MKLHRTAVAHTRRMIASTTTDAYTGCIAAFRNLDLFEELSQITAPVLFMVGEDDHASIPEIMRGMHDRLRFKPATRVENACATGSAAVHAALNFIEANKGRTALVIGAEKMTALNNRQVGDVLLGASYHADGEGSGPGGFAGVFGQFASAYFERHGNRSDSLARIAAKNHRNGVANPLAQIRKDLGYEFCRTVSEGNPLVAGPLRRTDCSPVSDGAAALILSNADVAAQSPQSVRFRAAVHVNDFLPISKRDSTRLEGCQVAW